MTWMVSSARPASSSLLDPRQLLSARTFQMIIQRSAALPAPPCQWRAAVEGQHAMPMLRQRSTLSYVPPRYYHCDPSCQLRPRHGAALPAVIHDTGSPRVGQSALNPCPGMLRQRSAHLTAVHPVPLPPRPVLGRRPACPFQRRAARPAARATRALAVSRCVRTGKGSVTPII
jgi:hypothetical protein